MNYPIYLHMLSGVPVAGVSLSILFPCYNQGMSLYHNFKARDGLPDPKGSLWQNVIICCYIFCPSGSVESGCHCALAFHKLACTRFPPRWAAVELLTARSVCHCVDLIQLLSFKSKLLFQPLHSWTCLYYSAKKVKPLQKPLSKF